MVFHDLVREERFDVWIADEAWEVDYFLHENPELKTAPYVWLTDFVGVLPMPDGGEREAFLAADYNAQMVEHVARNPRLRDRSIFIGDPDDIVPERLGPGLPAIRDWTEAALRVRRLHHRLRPGRDRRSRCAPRRVRLRARREGLRRRRRRLGRRDRPAASASPPRSRRRSDAIPELRMILVAGPRIDPRLAAARRRPRDPRLRPPALPAARRVRPRDHPRRPLHDDGADRGRAPLPLLPAPPALRAEPPRRPPARPPRRGAADGASTATGRRRSRPRSPRRSAAQPRYLAVEQHGAARAAEVIRELL